MFIRTPYNYDRDKASDESGFKTRGKSLTKQQFKDEANINVIVKRFGLTGQLPQNVRMPVQGDFTGLTSFKEAMDAVIAAKESFMEMPAEVRKRFNHDPAAFVEFCSDEKNREEAKRLGLMRPELAATLAAPPAPVEMSAALQATPNPAPPAPKAQ